MAVITAVTVASFFDYFHANRAILEEAWNARS
jgi:hypothetical protein